MTIALAPAPGPPPQPVAIPQEIVSRLARGKRERDKAKRRRELCRKFFEGQHYWFLDPRGNIFQRTSGGVGVVGTDKPAHRVRKAIPYIQMIVEAKVSAATQKTPGYEVTPSTNDQDARQAAALSEQVATFGYDDWKVRRARIKAVTTALVAREGFSLPFFDAQLGERDADGNAQGNIRILNFDRDHVMWEPEEDFDDSRWHAVERSQRPEEVQAMPGYCGGPLTMPDGTAPDRVNVTEYLERPCQRYPQGRRMFFAANRVMVDYRLDPQNPAAENPDADGADGADTTHDWWEPYPYIDREDRVVDEPILHRISYTVNPWGDDMSLVERLIDLQTIVDDCMNKLVEWKNRALMPQMNAPVGAKIQRRNDVPGAINYYQGQQAPEWEKVPPIPQELFQIYDTAKTEMRALASDVEVQAEARLSAGTANAAVEQGNARWASFLGDLAEYDSRFMRHCLVLVTRYFTEDRQIDIRGQYGWESLQAFDGADLHSQVTVKVQPESLEQTTRAQRQQLVQFLAANWPGQISAETAMGYIEGGAAAGLIESYKLQIARAWRIVKQLMAGVPPESLGTRYDPDVPNLALPMIPGPPSPGPIDPTTGQPAIDPLTGEPIQGPPTMVSQMGAEVPNYMPAAWDNIDIWRKVVGDAMSTEKFEMQPEPTREAMYEMWRGLDFSEQQRAQEQAAQQEMQAQSYGMGNAAKTQGPPPTPDKAGFAPGSNQSTTPSVEP